MIEHGAPSVCVSIVHYRNPDLLDACLQSFVEHPPTLPFRVVVVDNSASTHSVKERVERYPFVELREAKTNIGFSAGNNRGVEGATEDYYFFLNPDTKIFESTLENLVSFMERTPSAGALGPTNIGPDGIIQFSCRKFPNIWTVLANRYSFLTRFFPNNPISNRYLQTELDRGETQEVDWVSGAALMMRSEDFKNLRGFDEDYFLYSEDVDLCYRIHQIGKKVYFFPGSKIVHAIGGASGKSRYRSLWERHRSMYTFFRKHYSRDIPLLDLITLFGVLSRATLFLFLESVGRSPHR